jgi:hypothetical protein
MNGRFPLVPRYFRAGRGGACGAARLYWFPAAPPFWKAGGAGGANLRHSGARRTKQGKCRACFNPLPPYSAGQAIA